MNHELGEVDEAVYSWNAMLARMKVPEYLYRRAENILNLDESPQAMDEALEFLTPAADQGHIQSMKFAADILLRKDSIQAERKAMRYLIEATKRKHVDSCVRLVRHYMMEKKSGGGRRDMLGRMWMEVLSYLLNEDEAAMRNLGAVKAGFEKFYDIWAHDEESTERARGHARRFIKERGWA